MPWNLLKKLEARFSADVNQCNFIDSIWAIMTYTSWRSGPPSSQYIYFCHLKTMQSHLISVDCKNISRCAIKILPAWVWEDPIAHQWWSHKGFVQVVKDQASINMELLLLQSLLGGGSIRSWNFASLFLPAPFSLFLYVGQMISRAQG